MNRVGVIRNFTLGVDGTGRPSAFFDCYYDDSTSTPVSVTGAAQILQLLRAAGMFAHAGAVNGTPCILVDNGAGPVFDHIANF